MALRRTIQRIITPITGANRRGKNYPITTHAVRSMMAVARVYEYENAKRRLSKNATELVVKKTIKKKMVSPTRALLLKVLNIT